METNGTKTTIKKISCNLSNEDLQRLGEPVAYFQVAMPKEIKNLGDYTGKDGARPQLQLVCLEPGNGVLIASNCRILGTVEIDCDGSWPQDEDGKPFQCFIDPKAVREFVGKQVDIAVWVDGEGNKITACEAAGALAQSSLAGRFPDWKRAMPDTTKAKAVIASEAINRLRGFVKDNMGKTKAERKERFAVIHITPEADDMMVRIVNECGEEIAQMQADLCETPDWHIQQSFNAQLFYYSIQEDFNGEIAFLSNDRPVTFKGEMRTSILLPKAPASVKTYMTAENPEK